MSTGGKKVFRPFGAMPHNAHIPTVGIPADAIDRFGRIIGKGDQILVESEVPVVLTVVDVAVVLNPGAPGGRMISLTVSTSFKVACLPGQAAVRVIKVGETESEIAEQQPAGGQSSGDPTPPPATGDQPT